jgi:oligosaccharide repeat unit polymerase
MNNKLIIKKKYILLFFTSLLISAISILFIFAIDLDKIDLELFSLSIFFFLLITTVYIAEKDKYSPIMFFSILFYGYSFSGLYFSFYSNFHNARFFHYVSNDFSTYDFKIALTSVICGYIMFLIGYYFALRIKVQSLNLDIKMLKLDSNSIRLMLYCLFLISFLYWINLSFTLASGPFDLLMNIGNYGTLQENNPTSTLPYHLAYLASSLLFLGYLDKNKIPFYIKMIILLTFIILISKARLAGAVVYFASFFVIYIIYNKIKINYKIVMYVMLFFIILGSLFMARLYSNMAYIGKTIDMDIFELMGIHLFGRTNLGDLQSIVFTYEYITKEGYLLGESFLDFTTFWINKIFLLELNQTTVGNRLKDVFFNHVSGAPAPGIVSEVIMNFGILGLSLGMAFIGFIIAMFYKVFNPYISLLNLFIYVKFLFVVMLLAKVDSAVIDDLIWAALPIYSFIFIVVFFKLIAKVNYKKGDINGIS